MLETAFIEVYDKLKFEFCRMVFSLVRERDGSLSAMEAFSLEVISQLGRPTVGQFADFLNISQSNATYKVASLMRKGYIVKENSGEDRREYHLVLTPKYSGYVGQMEAEICRVVRRVERKYSPEEAQKLAEMLHAVASELEAQS